MSGVCDVDVSVFTVIKSSLTMVSELRKASLSLQRELMGKCALCRVLHLVISARLAELIV